MVANLSQIALNFLMYSSNKRVPFIEATFELSLTILGVEKQLVMNFNPYWICCIPYVDQTNSLLLHVCNKLGYKQAIIQTLLFLIWIFFNTVPVELMTLLDGCKWLLIWCSKIRLWINGRIWGESLRWTIEWKLGWNVNEKIEWRVWERQGLWKGKLWYHNKFANLKNEGENCCYLFFYSMFLQSLYTCCNK